MKNPRGLPTFHADRDASESFAALLAHDARGDVALVVVLLYSGLLVYIRCSFDSLFLPRSMHRSFP